MPSTLVAFRMTSAPISTARSAPAVSVVKNGLPVPAAKITTRPFSRWRIARRRMYGSAMARISMADSTRGDPAEDVAAPDHDRDLYLEIGHGADLRADPPEDVGIDPVRLGAGERL